MSRKVLFPVAAVLVLAIAAFLLGRFGVIDAPWTPDGEAHASEKSDDDGEVKAPPVPVELAQAGPRRISAYYRASSVIEADRLVDLVSRSMGRVRSMAVEEGDWVTRGQILAELENDREKIQLRQAKLRESDQRRELDRREKLLSQQLLKQEEFDATKSALDLAVADRELAHVTLEDTRIRAPFDGQITDRRIVPGQHVNATEALFTLVDFAPLRVRVWLPEVIARKVTPGDEVYLDVEAVDTPILATVERIAPVVDPNTSTVRLTLLVGEGAEELRVGGFVKVRITTDTQTEALSVPKLALVEEGGLRSVFVAQADSVRKVEVRTGLYDDSHIEILDGIEAGAFVVTLGQGGLRAGSKIDVLNSADVGWTSPETEDDDEKLAEEDDGEQHAESESEDGQAAVAMSDEAELDG